MPLLVLLFLVTACLPVRWPEPSVEAIAELTAAFVLLVLLASAALSLWAARHPRAALSSGAYHRWRRRLVTVTVLGTAACIGLGWGWTVQTGAVSEWRGEAVLAPFAELLVPGPYLLVVVLNWLTYYPAERALNAAARRSAEPFWSLPGFVWFQARQFALFLLLPVVVASGHLTVGRFAPEAAAAWWYHALSIGWVVFLLVFAPRLFRAALGMCPLPPGDLADHLRRTAARLGFTSDLLLWPTRNAAMNAVIVGFVPGTRFVAFTDKLLAHLDADEADAVFGHEVGHARHWHLPYYLGFFALSLPAVTLLTTAAAERLVGPTWDAPDGWGPVALMGALAAYLFVVFGFLSRACERQADVAGARAVSCGNPACDGHAADTPLTAGRGPVCATGARTMARALERVMAGSEDDRGRWWRRAGAWLKAWQHGPAAARVEFLYRLAENPDLAARHDRVAFRVRAGLAAGLLAAVAASGFAIGWARVWTML